MKSTRVAVLSVAALACAAGLALARSTPPEKKMTPEEVAKIAEQMMALAQPGPEHKVLERMAGEWKSRVTVSMMPGQPPDVSEGTSTTRMILGGRFLEIRNAGHLMGQPFEGLTILGFDRRSDLFTVVGYDTVGTYYVTGQGPARPDGTLVLSGTTHDPRHNHTEKYEFHYAQPDNDHLVWRILFDQGAGTMAEVVKVELTRVE
ncbi:MAG TPA: hypothetical protein DEB06_07740 [Phycisphaerales bacterium]|nr:hypothetical protein [Phycisphaerales bacterium]